MIVIIKIKFKEVEEEMVSAGFEFDQAAVDAMVNVTKRVNKWVVMQIPDGKDAGCAMVQCAAAKNPPEDDAEFDAFAACFPDDQPRWGIYDLNFMKNGVNNNKVIFVQYVPDDCTKNQLKFAYANHKETVKAKIQVNKEMQINDKCDITRAKFIDEF